MTTAAAVRAGQSAAIGTAADVVEAVASELLRLYSRIDALLTTLQPIAYVILFLIFTLVVFGLIAIGVFGGKLFACTNTNVVYPEGKKMCSGKIFTESYC